MIERASSKAKADQAAAGASPLAYDASSIEALSLVVTRIGKEGFDRALLAWLQSLVNFDSALILVYAPQQRPKILVDALDNPGRENSAMHYVEAAYLLDPFYQHARLTAEACLVQLVDIAPDNFSRSGYVETYYRRSAVRDEINFLIPIGDTTYAVALERSLRRRPFSTDDLARLRLLLPLVEALVSRQRLMVSNLDEGRVPDSEHLRLERILADFGNRVLTPREREVAGLMLRGYALAQIACRLTISLETARVHRRNLYEKLGISSLAELFSLALTDLASRR